MSAAVTEREILDGAAENLQAQGYEVYKRPPASMLPSFMSECVPHAVAYREDGNVALEIVHSTRPEPVRLKRMAELFEKQPRWTLHLLHAHAGSVPSPLPVERQADIRSVLAETEDLKGRRQTGAALVLGFSAMEAVARRLLAGRLDRPQKPQSVIEALTEEGFLSQEEARVLRSLASRRDTFVHGGFSELIDEASVVQLIGILKRLVDEPAAQAA